MSDPSTVLYQMGQAVSAKVSLGKSELLSGNNVWTGTSNNFQNNVSIGGNVSVGGSTALGSLSVLRAATFSDNVTVNGDLTVNGTTTALATTTLEVDDNIIHLSKGASDGPYDKDSGLYFERGSGSDPQALIWDESAGRFTLGALETSIAKPATFQIGDTTNNIVVTLASGTTFTSVSITSGPNTQFTANGTTLDLEIASGADLDEVGGAVFINANSYFDGNQPVLTGSGSTLVSTGTIAISPEDPGGQVTGPDDDTANVTPGPLRVGSVTITDQTDGEVALGDLTDFEAGLAS
jgi:hypothetical protein